ncbi:hypothetical protein ACLOJK_023403 [Asimina triloba]
MDATEKKKWHDTLDLDSPLLSTRRVGGNGVICPHSSCCSDVEQQRLRVPFLWERVPGDPIHVEEPPPPPPPLPMRLPKPPPCRWHPPVNMVNGDDDGNDGDDDDDDEDEDDDDLFLDAIDRASLSESSLDNHCSTSRASGMEGLIDLKAIESCSDQYSPNFIMRRFLPAATALAAASSIHLNAPNSSGLNNKQQQQQPSSKHKEINTIGCRRMQSTRRYHDDDEEISRCEEHGRGVLEAPNKACGLMLFFPWNLKHALRGLKNPIPSCSPRLRLVRNGRRRTNFAVAGDDDGPSRHGWI